jgi:hypothetical protein
MTIPTRLVAEYPQRCLELIGELEPAARKRDLVGSFSLLVAPAVFVIPYERMGSGSSLYKRGRDGDLSNELKSLKKVRFVGAPFWKGNPPFAWRFSRIMANVDHTAGWVDEDGRHPMEPRAKNFLAESSADDVLRAIRNALAHGNIVYLNDQGLEDAGAKLHFLALVSQHIETPKIRAKRAAYRVVAVTEDEFLRFVKLWAEWISQFRGDDRLSEVA